jgi:O-antigen/teichoic acid export membrane protein
MELVFGQMGRRKNATRNLIYSGLDKVYYTIVPFLLRTAILYYLGAEYLGLNGLFTSLFQVLNLAELGVGDAMVYSMYKPFAENDQTTLCALLRLYKYFYRIIGTVILVLGLIVMPFLPQLIYGDTPADINLMVLYLLHLFSVVMSYWLFAYRSSLLIASQRSDIKSKLQLITRTVYYALQFIAICVFKNYYFFVIASVLFQIANNLVIAAASRKMYPRIEPKGDLGAGARKDISQRIRDLFTAKVGGVIVNYADSIVVSAFLGLVWLALYQNYYYVIVAVSGMIGIFFQSCTAGIGNSIVTESGSKNYHDFELMTLITLWLINICACCMLALYQPFMTIWVGMDMLLDYKTVICFCIYFGVMQINSLLCTYKDASGIWHADRFRPLVTAICNLTMNILTIGRWRLYGVILSTVLSTLLIGIPWIIHNLFRTIFEMRYMKVYVRKLLSECVRIFMICVICTLTCNLVTGNEYLVIVVRLVICILLSNILFYIVFRKENDFLEVMKMVFKIFKKEEH